MKKDKYIPKHVVPDYEKVGRLADRDRKTNPKEGQPKGRG